MDNTEVEERLYQLIERFEQHERSEKRVTSDLFKAQQANTDAIAKITDSVSKLVEDTGDIIKLHRDFQGAARVGKGVQGFLLWLLKWGVIGTGVATVVMWLIERFNHHA